ncbi:hypothetical protein D3C72_1694510 [compost metagenome]
MKASSTGWVTNTSQNAKKSLGKVYPLPGQRLLTSQANSKARPVSTNNEWEKPR